MTNSNDHVITKVVYLGRRLLSDRKLGDAYITLEAWEKSFQDVPNQDTGIELIERFKSVFEAHKPIGIIGAVYDMPCKMEGDKITSISYGARKFNRKLNDPNLAHFEASDQSAYAEHRAIKLEAKIKGDSIIANQMRGLQEMYRKTAYADRLAFEMIVLNNLRRGRI